MALPACKKDDFTACGDLNTSKGCCLMTKVKTLATDAQKAEINKTDATAYDTALAAVKALGFGTTLEADATYLCITEDLKATWNTTAGTYMEPTTDTTYDSMCMSGASKIAMTLAAGVTVLAAAF